MSSCKFPETRRLDVSCSYISIDSNLKAKAKEIVKNFISTQEEYIIETDVIYDFDSTTDCCEISTFSNLSWKERSQKITTHLLKRISLLKRQIIINQEHISKKRDAMLKFVKLARTNSLLAADLLHECKGGVANGSGQWLKSPKIRCCKVTNGQQCSETALLYSRYCLSHITNDKRQILYQSCTTIDSDTVTKCNRPVLELLQDKPYCLKHMTESKKTTKLTPTSGKGQGIKQRKTSPGVQKIKAQDVTKKSPVTSLSLSSPLPPPSTSFLPPPLSSSWNLTDNEGETNRPSRLPSPPKDGIIQRPPSNTLSPFALEPSLPSLPLPTPVLLLPPDPTPGCFLDDDSPSDEGN